MCPATCPLAARNGACGCGARAGYDPVKVVSIPHAHFIVPIGLAPGDRKQEALPLMQTILENAVLCVPQKVSSRGCFSRAKALELIAGISRQVRLKASLLDAPVTSLSGGNQQKVVLTRWRASDLKVLILDHPTRDFDVGARSEIHDLIRSLTDTRGLGVIVISWELPELLGLSDRVMVMAGGRIRAEFDRSGARIAAMCSSLNSASRRGPVCPKAETGQ
ncbi:ribose import ATP-binding protein RbsA 2 [Citreicella sp. SE45]|nr:ribose import ATP-binding protein RbsA 2 [Citreicella sp. SE45]